MVKSQEHEGDYDRQVKAGPGTLLGHTDCKYPSLCIALVISFSMLEELLSPKRCEDQING